MQEQSKTASEGSQNDGYCPGHEREEVDLRHSKKRRVDDSMRPFDGRFSRSSKASSFCLVSSFRVLPAHLEFRRRSLTHPPVQVREGTHVRAWIRLSCRSCSTIRRSTLRANNHVTWSRAWSFSRLASIVFVPLHVHVQPYIFPPPNIVDPLSSPSLKLANINLLQWLLRSRLLSRYATNCPTLVFARRAH